MRVQSSDLQLLSCPTCLGCGLQGVNMNDDYVWVHDDHPLLVGCRW